MRESSRLNISLAVGVIFLLSIAVYVPIINADDTVDDLVFIHHSCGNNWLNDGLHDTLLAKSYIDERNDITYGTDISPDTSRPDSLSSTPGDKTNMDHWIYWFNDYLNNVKNHGCTDGFNKIIMFKSCYPGSDIAGDGTEPGDPFSSTKILANYKAVYRHYNGPGEIYTDNGYIYKPLQDIFAENPDILFIPVTAPPLHYTATNDANAHRARMFNNWLKNDWLNDYNSEHPGLNNVAVYDWFDFLAYSNDHSDHPNRLKGEYGGGSGNSHPNTLANQESTVDFATGTNNFIDTAWNTYNDETDINDWELHIQPENQVAPIGSYVEIAITANTTGITDPVSGWEIEVLNFTDEYLQLNSISEGNWLSTVGTTSFNPGTIHNIDGTLTDTYCMTMGENTTANGTFCVLNFTAINPGISDINYTIELSFEGKSISYTANFGMILVSSMQNQNNPPVLSNPIPSNTTSTALSYRNSQIWSISITDFDGDKLLGTIKSSNQTSSIDGEDDVYSIYLTNLSSGTHTVYVEVTDGTSWTKEWFRFTIDKQQIDNGSDPGEDTNTPGFEILLLISAIIVTFFIQRKQKGKHK